MNDTRKFSIAVVDDHFAIRDGYKNYLQKLNYIMSVKCFAFASDLMNELSVNKFDLVLMDIELGSENGLEVCEVIKNQYPETKVMMVSTFKSEAYLVKSDMLKADGYLFKDADPGELKRALEQVLFQNERYYPLTAKEKLFDYRSRFINGEAIITEREKDIIRLICEGKTNKEIGDIVNRSEATIAKHRQNIMRKLKVHRSIEIINYAVNNGIYVLDPKDKTRLLG